MKIQNTDLRALISKRVPISAKLSILFLIFAAFSIVNGQSTAFTYQGKLAESGLPANGTYDLQFKLYDAAANGNQIGSTITNAAVHVNQGIFTVNLDYGTNGFDGSDKYLEIAVRPQGSPNAYTILGPRQSIASAPYAIRSKNAAKADTATSADTAGNSTQLGGVNADQYVLTTDPRLVQTSGNFIQNSASQQASANFNISGNGTTGGTLSGDTVNAETEYTIFGHRFVSVGPASTFVGIDAGTNNGGGGNSFFGAAAGNENSTGDSNTFIGATSGIHNISGTYNSFVGRSSGGSNTDGSSNAFFGVQAGFSNTVGHGNAFFGNNAGQANVNGFRNTAIGVSADVGAGNLSNATAIGYGALVNSSNSVVLGKDANVGIGTGSPAAKLHILENGGNILFGNGGCNAGFAGIGFAATLTCGNYSLLGEGTNTILNRRSGGAISFRENNIQQFAINTGGTVSINTLGSGGTTQLCRNPSNQISTCSSSLRYKTNINPFTSGLNTVRQFIPIAFDWKDGGMHDLGLGAEDVAKVNELLVIRNEKGEVEGVKYDRIGVVLINAVKEQQTEIEELRKEIQLLKALVLKDRDQNIETQPAGKEPR